MSQSVALTEVDEDEDIHAGEIPNGWDKPPSKYMQPQTRRELILDLALGQMTYMQIAKKYDRHYGSVASFARRNRDAIARVRSDLSRGIASSEAGLWIADKTARVSEYQNDVELINQVVGSQLDDDGEVVGELDTKLLRIKHGALHSVAEELGQLPTRTAVMVDNTHVTYTVLGIDPEELQ